MSHNPYAATQIDDVVAVDDHTTFYVVTPRKMAVLYLATLGLYGMYWFYKHWSNYKRSRPVPATFREKIWPLPRALFAWFFVAALFREVKAKGGAQPEVAAWRQGVDAGLLIVLLLASTALNRASYRADDTVLLDVLALLILVPIALLMAKVQRLVNIACGDPEARRNSRYTVANACWLAVGAVLWLLVLVGLLAGE